MIIPTNLDFIDKVSVCHFCKQRHKDDVLYRVFTCGEYYQHWDFENQKGCAENKNNIDPDGNYHKQFNPTQL